MIKKIYFVDFDGTLSDSPMPDVGKKQWEKVKGTAYPYRGWWGRPESLDTSVFNIKMFPSMEKIVKSEINNPDSLVIILTSRLEKLQPQLEKILSDNNINVDEVMTKTDERTKGQKVLDFLRYHPDVTEVNVYDDRDTDISSYKEIKNSMPEGVKLNIYVATDGNLSLVESHDKLLNIVNEEILNFNTDSGYIYHGTNDAAGYHIQNDGKMKINAANNNEPFISFTSKPATAKYYANMKGGSNRGLVLRTKKTEDFILSPKFEKNDGYEWTTTREIPVNELEISTKYGWIPLSNWDFIDKKSKNLN